MNKQFENDMKLRKDPFVDGAFEFNWRNLIRGCIARFDKEINIQGIWSNEEGKGNCQEFVKLLKEDCKHRGLILASSVPISPIWRHICVKFDIKIYE